MLICSPRAVGPRLALKNDSVQSTDIPSKAFLVSGRRHSYSAFILSIICFAVYFTGTGAALGEMDAEGVGVGGLTFSNASAFWLSALGACGSCAGHAQTRQPSETRTNPLHQIGRI